VAGQRDHRPVQQSGAAAGAPLAAVDQRGQPEPGVHPAATYETLLRLVVDGLR
jgi:hypothetical protein